jgi:hypothetical protein
MRRRKKVVSVKTIRVKEDTWLELVILKYKLRKQDMNELLRHLLERYQECYQKAEAEKK